eukprot:GSChrysophyteH1.ASY1.ANO1.2331.1 assembled CDS
MIFKVNWRTVLVLLMLVLLAPVFCRPPSRSSTRVPDPFGHDVLGDGETIEIYQLDMESVDGTGISVGDVVAKNVGQSSSSPSHPSQLHVHKPNGNDHIKAKNTENVGSSGEEESGRWIVKLHKPGEHVEGVSHDSFEKNLHVANEASIREFQERRKLSRQGGVPIGEATEEAELDLSVQIHHRYSNVFHGIVVSGHLVDKVFLESVLGAHSVRKDTVKSIHNQLWAKDRVDQENLPLDGAFSSQRTVANIFNAYGNANAANTDGDGHGTHCAASAAGVNIGTAPASNLYGMKVLGDDGSGLTSDIVAAVDMVISRVNSGSNRAVINMSLGGPCYGGDNTCSAESDATIEAVDAAVDAGIIVVVAAGNEYANACYSSPAAAPKAITVGGTDIQDYISSFSNFGRCVEILAPGSDVVSACSTLKDSCATDNYISMSGTSMASPLVAGVVALFLEADSGASRLDILERMYCTGTLNRVTYFDSARSNLDVYTKNILPRVPQSGADYSQCKTNLGGDCSNSCSGHGVCMPTVRGSGSNMCKCYDGYYTSDCSITAAMPSQHLCSNGLTQFTMFDDEEDGWNDAYYAIVDENTGETVSDSYDALYDGHYKGERYHCLPDGCYNLIVTEGRYHGEIAWVLGDNPGGIGGGSPWNQRYCIDSSGGNKVLTPKCDNGEIVDLVLYDSYGDGWQGSYYRIKNMVTNVWTHAGYMPYEDNYEWTHKLCLAYDACHNVYMAGIDSFPEENSWKFGGVMGDLVGGPTTAQVCVGSKPMPTAAPTT